MYKFYIILLCSFFLSCGNEKKEPIYTEALPVTIHDTIVIYDTVPYLYPIYVKKSNHDEAILPVDSILTRCIKEKAHSTTIGMIDCYNSISEELLIKIQTKEKQLVSFLDKPHQDLLKKSQLQWRAFIKAEGDFLYTTYYTDINTTKYPSLGREASIDQAQWKYIIIRDRLIALETYYERVYYQK